MKQLVELDKHAEQFTEANAEVVIVFREEKEGVEGLKKIKQNTNTPFKLALDFGKEKTGRYSPGKREFSNYVINPEGKITKIIDGDVKNRATSKELLKAVADASKAQKAGASDTKAAGSETKAAGSATKAGSETKGSASQEGSGTQGSGSK